MENKIKKNYFYNLLYKLVMIVTPLIISPYISRVLGAEKIGEYSFAYSIAHVFLVIALLGIGDYGCRTIAKCKNDIEKRNTVFSEIFYFQLIMSVFLCVSYIVYCFFICNEKNMAFTQIPLVLSALFDISWLIFGLEKFYISTIRSVIVKIITIILILLFVKQYNDLWIYGVIMSASVFVTQLSIWPILYKYVHFRKVSFSGILRHIKPNLILFLPVVANNLLGYFDKIMIGTLSTKAELGCYDSAEKLLSFPNSVITALGGVMLPRVSNALAYGEEEKINDYLYKTLIFMIFASSALSFGIASISNEFIPVFFGEGFDLVISLIFCLFPTIIFICWANVMKTQILLPREKDKLLVVSIISGAILNLILNLILIPNYGSIGAAFATMISEGLIAILGTIFCRKYFNIKRNLFNTIPFVLFGAIMMVSIIFIHFDNDILTIIVKVGVGAGIYLTLSLLYIMLFHKQIFNSFKKRSKKV